MELRPHTNKHRTYTSKNTDDHRRIQNLGKHTSFLEDTLIHIFFNFPQPATLLLRSGYSIPMTNASDVLSGTYLLCVIVCSFVDALLMFPLWTGVCCVGNRPLPVRRAAVCDARLPEDCI